MVYLVACRGKDAAGRDIFDQLAAILPSDTPLGLNQVVVTHNGVASTPVTVEVVKRAFGIFTQSSTGSGHASLQNYVPDGLPVLNTMATSLQPGGWGILWGTGLGPINGNDAEAPLGTPVPGAAVEVLVGGKPSPQVFFGRSSQFPGIDQISFQVPPGIEGCGVPLTVLVDGVPSNTATASVAAEGPVCSDPQGLTQTEILRAQANNAAKVGTITLEDSWAKASFTKEPLAQFLATPRGLPPGGCLTVSASLYSATEAASPPPGLDAGAAIRISGPNGTRLIDKYSVDGVDHPGIYSTSAGMLSEPLLEPGSYTISNASGGTAVGPFSLNLAVPPRVSWTNKADVSTVSRASGLTVTWSGGTPDAYVWISGFSTSGFATGLFYCLEKSAAHQFTVPAWVLESLPATGSGPEDSGAVKLRTSVSTRIDPLPSGLDIGVVTTSLGETLPVKFQ